ncbi:MAG: Uma2 family endonuclease [Acidobacteria bacterium]|nr:Uma2 family endonuclease [Acidobacteriota bacterium]
MGLAKIKTKPAYTFAEYLAIDRESAERYEYLDGEIYLMAGESGAHGDICMNLAIAFGNQTKGTGCRGRIKDTKVLSGAAAQNTASPKGMFSYPDLVVICGPPQYHDKHEDVVVNPKLIIEVLSESTESFDRGEKFIRYRMWNSTLTDYLLVSQTAPLVEHYIKQSDGSWLLREYRGLETSFRIETIAADLNLADIYDRIEFDNDL